MRAELQAALTELAEIAKGAAEREIETEIVYILKQAGWPRSQIKQDVSISDKGADKADVVLYLDNQPFILVEVKKHGHSRDADNQVNRYCRLLSPSPKLAFLTDGTRWMLYYVGQAGALPIQETLVPIETANIASMLTAFNPTSLSALIHSGAFQYLDIAEQGLRERSEEAQKHLRHFFASTVKALLIPGESSVEVNPPVVANAQFPAAAEKKIPQQQTLQTSLSQQSNNAPTEYDAFQPPPLSFTNSVTARFADNAAGNWSELLRTAIKNALDSGRTVQDIRRIANINIQEVKNADKGFTLISGTNLSVQGQSADNAWQNSLKLARTLGCTIEADFRWSDDRRASKPGESGSLRWHP